MPLVILLSLAACVAAHSAEISLYVAPGGDDRNPGTTPARPFATLERARDEARKLKSRGSVVVYLRGGLYTLTRPIVFTPQDSGSAAAPVTYAAYAGERPVLSGGRAIKGWTRGANGVWTTVIQEVKDGRWRFNQLYVNGKLRRRARIPNEGFLRVAGFPEGTPKTVNYHTDCQSFEFRPGDIRPDWRNLEDVEVIVYHFWTDSHLPIQSIDTAKNIVTFKHKAGKVFTDDFTEDGARYIVENVYEGLDAPGEWYLDRKTGVLSYIPMPDEDMKTAEVMAPLAPALVNFEGDPAAGKFVEHLRFRGLTFQYTNFQLPPGNSNDKQGSASVPAAITARGMRFCEFDRCEIRNLGTFAFELQHGCRYNRFTSNELAYLAAGGFRIDGGTEKEHPLLRSGHNVIADNHLHHYGEVYPSAVGVLLMNTNGNQVIHNHIHHGWYTAVSLGWRWGYWRSVSRDNLVEYNHIHDIGQGLLSDMGGIYTLGVSPGTVLRYNKIYRVDANQYGGWGIYHDEGSTHILVEKNLVYDTKYCGFNIHYAKECTVRNNIFAFGRVDQLSLGRVEPHVSVYFENNIVYWTEGVLMRQDKPDKPYKMWISPKPRQDAVEFTSTVDSDWNLFFNPNHGPQEARIGKASFLDWQKRGKDRHSLYADPLFVNAAARDFRLRPESPAFALGFEEFDLSRVGPRTPVGGGR
jgi:parallel beta-helix repeat protein